MKQWFLSLTEEERATVLIVVDPELCSILKQVYFFPNDFYFINFSLFLFFFYFFAKNIVLKMFKRKLQEGNGFFFHVGEDLGNDIDPSNKSGSQKRLVCFFFFVFLKFLKKVIFFYPHPPLFWTHREIHDSPKSFVMGHGNKMSSISILPRFPSKIPTPKNIIKDFFKIMF